MSEFVYKLHLFLKTSVLIAVFYVGEVKFKFVASVLFYSLFNAIVNIPFLSLLPFQARTSALPYFQAMY